MNVDVPERDGWHMVKPGAPVPESAADVHNLAEKLMRGKISPEDYFAAVNRRAERLSAQEARAGETKRRGRG